MWQVVNNLSVGKAGRRPEKVKETQVWSDGWAGGTHETAAAGGRVDMRNRDTLRRRSSKT